MRLAAAIAFSILAAPAVADGIALPPRKPGAWEMKIQVAAAAMPPQIIRMCLDVETDTLVNAKFGGMASSLCTRQEQRREGDALVLDSDCHIGDMRAVSHTVVTGDFDSGYRMTTDVEMTGSLMGRNRTAVAPAGPMTQSTTVDAARTGACAADRKPGDIELGDGRVINVRDMPDPKIQ